MIQILLPELGEGITSVEISDICVNVGDNLSIDDILIVVETDKASMEIPATEAGEVLTVHIADGDSLSPGEPIVTLSGEASSIQTNQEVEEPPTEVIQQETIETPPTQPVTSAQVKTPIIEREEVISASPSVRRFARELGCNLRTVTGTGQKGRVTKKDVENYF